MVYFETPTTPAEFTELLAEIFWPADCNQQQGAIATLLAVMDAVQRGLAALTSVRLHVFSDTPPGQSDWEAAWIKQGRALPITGDVIGIWETATEATKDSAQYVWIEGAMRPTLAKYWNGSSEFFLTTPGMYGNPVASLGGIDITTTYAEYITQPIVLKRDAYIHAAYAYTELTTASGTYVQWRSSIDGASDVRSVLRMTTTGVNKRLPQLRFTPAAKVSSGTLRHYFKLNAAGAKDVIFKNSDGTRKVETGLNMASSPPAVNFPGEISALATEAIYLA